jgi:hypothetical protein
VIMYLYSWAGPPASGSVRAYSAEASWGPSGCTPR